MRHSLPEDLLAAVSQFVESRLGIHIPAGRLVDLERGLRGLAKEVGAADVAAFANNLLSAPITQETEDLLAAHLTIGETYFYRDPRAFEVLEKEVLPAAARAREWMSGGDRKIRIWSAACCTGEEPYSIAMAARRVLGDGSSRRVSILATDLNPRFLRKAASGIYGQWSFRALPEEMRARFFHQRAPDRWEIDDRLKLDVTFAPLNFMDDTFPSAANGTEGMDVIFCRNVLMYFSRETAAKVIAKLRRCLVDGGWLFTSATDAPRDLFAGFTMHETEGTIVYRRCDEVPQVVKPASSTSRATPSVNHLNGSRKDSPARPEITRPVARVSSTPAPPAQPPPSASVERHQHARRLADQGQFDEALIAINLAIAVDKLDPVAHYLRGVILHEQNLEMEAAAALNRALFLDPGFALAHVALGNLMRRGGKLRAANKCFENARDILRSLDRDAVLPESGGITAGRLLHMLSNSTQGAAA
jgi:chemotaxis protein methyltransferase CheR